MKFRASVLIGICAVLGGGAFGWAQSINGTIKVGNASAVPLTGSPFTGSNNHVNIAIDLSDPAYNISGGAILSDVIIVLADPNANASLDSLSIAGSFGATGARLSIVVANAQSAFPQLSGDPLQNAITDFGTLSIPNAALRDNTRIAIAGKGNLVSALTAGHVFKLQFNGDAGTGAELLGAVTATTPNSSFLTDTGLDDSQGNPIFAEPIAYIRAGKKIAAPITATAGDIGIISIGTTEAATDGLRADVTAPAGSIRSIYCAGRIGEAAARPQIKAKNVIGEIIAVDVEAPIQPLLDRDFFAQPAVRRATRTRLVPRLPVRFDQDESLRRTARRSASHRGDDLDR